MKETTERGPGMRVVSQLHGSRLDSADNSRPNVVLLIWVPSFEKLKSG